MSQLEQLQLGNAQPGNEWAKNADKALRLFSDSLIKLLNKGLKFIDNNDIDFVTVTTSAVAGTEVAVSHSLKRTPAGYLIASKDKAGIVYDGSTAWSSSSIYIKGSVASITTKLIIFQGVMENEILNTGECQIEKIREIDDSPEAIRKKILQFEEELAKLPGVQFGDQDDCPLKHSFGNGIYMREIFIPKGKLGVGKLHKHDHPNVLMVGDVTVITEHGGTERLKAPKAMISKAGTKRALFAHEDSIWITFHNVGEERNLDTIEDIVIAKTYNELPDSVKRELGLDEKRMVIL